MKSNPWILYVLTACVLAAAVARQSLFGIISTSITTKYALTLAETKDPYKCSAALTSGTWLDPPVPGTPSSFTKWQPNGCMTRMYAAKKAARCLGRYPEKHSVFVGDSTVRELFWATARALNKKTAAEAATKAEKHSNVDFNEGDTAIRFVWDPFLNSSEATQYMGRSRSKVSGSQESSSNELVVVGGGLWFAKDDPSSVESFKDAVDALTNHLSIPDLDTISSSRPFIVPVQPPLYDKLDSDHKPTMTPAKIDAMNDYLEEVAVSHDINYVSSFLRMVDDMPATAYEPRGLHVMPQIADKQAEIIMNLHCNNFEREYTYDGTCCFQYSFDWAQIALLFGGTALLLVVSAIELQAWTSNSGQVFLDGVEKRQPILWPALVMWLSLIYCIFTDRTHLFNKLQKLYNNQDFFIFVAAIALAGFGTIRRSASPSKSNQEKPAQTDQPFLSRDQTDEWKGWMQAMILAYHYTGASKILWIYKLIRLMVASYLFMTGYGHAAYFYSKADFSLKRVVAVNIRINLLSVLLPWFMGTDYLFYYFAPLVTYWYIVIYVTMRIKSAWNQQLSLFLLKIVIAACCTTALHSQPWLLDPIFKGVNAVFGAKWDAREWMFRCALDQYIVYTGMIVSVLYIRASKPPSPPPPPQSSMATTSFTQPGSPPHLRNSLYFAASLSALVVYGYGSSTRTTKTSSNALHTYISPLAILAFIHLRNCTRGMRNHYSSAYAWLGKISLETFVLQYHIWLAADTKGLLSLGWFGDGGMSQVGMLGRGMGIGRWMDCLLLGIVFVWVSLKVSDSTAAITGWSVKKLFG